MWHLSAATFVIQFVHFLAVLYRSIIHILIKFDILGMLMPSILKEEGKMALNLCPGSEACCLK